MLLMDPNASAQRMLPPGFQINPTLSKLRESDMMSDPHPKTLKTLLNQNSQAHLRRNSEVLSWASRELQELQAKQDQEIRVEQAKMAKDLLPDPLKETGGIEIPLGLSMMETEKFLLSQPTSKIVNRNKEKEVGLDDCFKKRKAWEHHKRLIEDTRAYPRRNSLCGINPVPSADETKTVSDAISRPTSTGEMDPPSIQEQLKRPILSKTMQSPPPPYNSSHSHYSPMARMASMASVPFNKELEDFYRRRLYEEQLWHHHNLYGSRAWGSGSTGETQVDYWHNASNDDAAARIITNKIRQDVGRSGSAQSGSNFSDKNMNVNRRFSLKNLPPLIPILPKPSDVSTTPPSVTEKQIQHQQHQNQRSLLEQQQLEEERRRLQLIEEERQLRIIEEHRQRQQEEEKYRLMLQHQQQQQKQKQQQQQENQKRQQLQLLQQSNRYLHGQQNCPQSKVSQWLSTNHHGSNNVPRPTQPSPPAGLLRPQPIPAGQRPIHGFEANPPYHVAKPNRPVLRPGPHWNALNSYKRSYDQRPPQQPYPTSANQRDTRSSWHRPCSNENINHSLANAAMDRANPYMRENASISPENNSKSSDAQQDQWSKMSNYSQKESINLSTTVRNKDGHIIQKISAAAAAEAVASARKKLMTEHTPLKADGILRHDKEIEAENRSINDDHVRLYHQRHQEELRQHLLKTSLAADFRKQYERVYNRPYNLNQVKNVNSVPNSAAAKGQERKEGNSNEKTESDEKSQQTDSKGEQIENVKEKSHNHDVNMNESQIREHNAFDGSNDRKTSPDEKSDVSKSSQNSPDSSHEAKKTLASSSSSSSSSSGTVTSPSTLKKPADTSANAKSAKPGGPKIKWHFYDMNLDVDAMNKRARFELFEGREVLLGNKVVNSSCKATVSSPTSTTPPESTTTTTTIPTTSSESSLNRPMPPNKSYLRQFRKDADLKAFKSLSSTSPAAPPTALFPEETTFDDDEVMDLTVKKPRHDDQRGKDNAKSDESLQ